MAHPTFAGYLSLRHIADQQSMFALFFFNCSHNLLQTNCHNCHAQKETTFKTLALNVKSQLSMNIINVLSVNSVVQYRNGTQLVFAALIANDTYSYL